MASKVSKPIKTSSNRAEIGKRLMAVATKYSLVLIGILFTIALSGAGKCSQIS